MSAPGKHEHAHTHDHDGHDHDAHGHGDHEHGHAHGHDHHDPTHAAHGQHDHPAEEPARGEFTAGEARQAKGLATVLVIVTLFFGFELAGALVARSVVLKADALHLLMDVLALAISLVAMRVAVRRPTPRFTFGMRRAEPVAGIFNAMLVLGVIVEIVHDGLSELGGNEKPRPDIMLIVSIAALFVNGISAWLLHGVLHEHGPSHKHDHAHAGHDHADEEHGDHAMAPARSGGHSLNLRGAWLHLLGDALGAVAALVAAVAIKVGGSVAVDAYASFVVAGILVFSAGRVVRDATLVLLEAAPLHAPVGAVREVILAFDGIAEVHDLHVWTLGAGHDAIMAHVRASVVDGGIARRLSKALREKFETEYVTVQVESPEEECAATEES